jgi:MraZ protein
MFLGTFHYRLDDKGRLTFPPAFRTVFHDTYSDDDLVITRFDRCLNVFPRTVMLQLHARLKQSHSVPENLIPFLRNMFYGATQCRPDKQGRILLPPKLRDYAGIGQEAVLVGIMEHIEIWNPETMDNYLEEGRDNIAQITETFSTLLFSAPGEPDPGRSNG